jgi:hypothetical protein
MIIVTGLVGYSCAKAAVAVARVRMVAAQMDFFNMVSSSDEVKKVYRVTPTYGDGGKADARKEADFQPR